MFPVIKFANKFTPYNGKFKEFYQKDYMKTKI